MPYLNPRDNKLRPIDKRDIEIVIEIPLSKKRKLE